MFFPSLLYKSQETVMHWDLSFPFPSSNNPKKIGVFDPTYIQTNKQTNNQTPDTTPETPERWYLWKRQEVDLVNNKIEIQVLAA